jgi:hypothetical protein
MSLNPPARLQSFFGQVKEAILTYQVIYGDLNIPWYFQIPKDTDWHPYLHGMNLGNIYEDIMNGLLFTQHHATLSTMGINISNIPCQPEYVQIDPSDSRYHLKGKRPRMITPIKNKRRRSMM